MAQFDKEHNILTNEVIVSKPIGEVLNDVASWWARELENDPNLADFGGEQAGMRNFGGVANLDNQQSAMKVFLERAGWDGKKESLTLAVQTAFQNNQGREFFPGGIYGTRLALFGDGSTGRMGRRQVFDLVNSLAIALGGDNNSLAEVSTLESGMQLLILGKSGIGIAYTLENPGASLLLTDKRRDELLGLK